MKKIAVGISICLSVVGLQANITQFDKAFEKVTVVCAGPEDADAIAKDPRWWTKNFENAFFDEHQVEPGHIPVLHRLQEYQLFAAQEKGKPATYYQCRVYAIMPEGEEHIVETGNKKETAAKKAADDSDETASTTSSSSSSSSSSESKKAKAGDK